MVPAGWHRTVVCEDEEEEGFDPWFSFIQELAFGVDENFDAYDSGLLSFVTAGPGEEWRLVEVGGAEGGRGEAAVDWRPEPGWQQVDLNVENMMQFMPRMGYLFTDGVFQLEHVAEGKQRFIMRGSQLEQQVARQHSVYRFTLKVGDEWLQSEDGFVDVELSDSMMGDLGVNPEFQEDVKSGRKKVVGKLLD